MSGDHTNGLDCAGIGVWEIVPATATWRCSSRCKQLLGVAEDDDPLDALSEEDRRRFSEAIARAMLGGEYRLDFRTRERWLSATGRVVRNERGPASIVGTLQDITAQKVALEERELRLAEVAHDLLNPLTAIRIGISIADARYPATSARICSSRSDVGARRAAVWASVSTS